MSPVGRGNTQTHPRQFNKSFRKYPNARTVTSDTFILKDCIPVGCVPPARRPYLPGPGVGGVPGWGGGVTWSRCTWLGGVPGLGVVPGPGGVPGPRGCTWSGGVPGPGVCTWSRGVVPGPGGVPGQWCTWSWGGVPGPRGVYLVRYSPQ